MPRPYRSNDHLWSTITTDAGVIAVIPNRADSLHFDVAWSSAFPADREEGEHGSTVLNLGRGIQARAMGNARLVDGTWTVSHLSAQRRSRGDLTPTMRERLLGLLNAALADWASTHAGDIAQADDIDRNNAARRLEEHIKRHEDALAILWAQLTACEEGEPFTQYPDLPTDGRS